MSESTPQPKPLLRIEHLVGHYGETQALHVVRQARNVGVCCSKSTTAVGVLLLLLLLRHVLLLLQPLLQLCALHCSFVHESGELVVTCDV